jgi:hypothetical protein
MDKEIEKICLHLQTIIDKYHEEQTGLPALQPTKAPAVLTLPIHEIRRKTPDELIEFNLELVRYAMYIERVLNREKSWERWAKLKLDEYTGHYLQDLSPNYGFNERMLIAKTQPTPCKMINNFIKELQIKITNLQNIPEHIKAMADCIRDIKFMNIRREKNNE